MQIRVVQIWGFLMTVLGWIFVACTMAMEGWKISSIGGMGGSAILKVAWYWSSLWRSCFTDSTAISNCYDYPVLWSVEGYIQIVRGLLMSALSLGMLGFVLSLLGMECTFIGGKDRSKYKKIYAGGLFHILSGLLSTSGYAVYAQYVSVEYFSPTYDGLKYDLGTPLFLGWVGSAFHMTGGFFYLWSVCKPLCGAEEIVLTVQAQPDPELNKATAALSTVSEIASKSKVSSVSEIASKSKVSSVSELSTKSEYSDLSGISSRLGRTFKSARGDKPGRPSKTGQTSRPARSRSGSSSGSESQFAVSSVSSASTSSESSSSSQTMSSLSGSLRIPTKQFSKNSYI